MFRAQRDIASYMDVLMQCSCVGSEQSSQTQTLQTFAASRKCQSTIALALAHAAFVLIHLLDLGAGTRYVLDAREVLRPLTSTTLLVNPISNIVGPGLG
jgi:hypothetical protein